MANEQITPIDVRFCDNGTIVMIECATEAARAWTDEHLSIEDWQWYGCAFACEPRCADAVIEAMMDDDLRVMLA